MAAQCILTFPKVLSFGYRRIEGPIQTGDSNIHLVPEANRVKRRAAANEPHSLDLFVP